MSTKTEETNTERAILEAAEREFLDKGYAASRTTEIARQAGVTHAMLHYYYRTKENLFDKVFDDKLRLLNQSFSMVFEQNLSFADKVRRAVETHFDFLAANPKLPSFLLREIVANSDRRETFKGMLYPKLIKIFTMLEKELKTEEAKGNVAGIMPADLLLNIGALNAASIVGALVLFEKDDEESRLARNAFLKQRRESTVAFVLRGLKP